MNARSIILIICLIVVTVISTQNTHSITLKFLFWDMSISLIILMYILIALGFMIGFSYTNISKKIKGKSVKKIEE